VLGQKGQAIQRPKCRIALRCAPKKDVGVGGERRQKPPGFFVQALPTQRTHAQDGGQSNPCNVFDLHEEMPNLSIT
jgi:hypothetical protein